MKLLVLLVVIAGLILCSAAAFGNLYGVDVSSYQGTINWDTLNASTNFAVMRASLGASSRDAQLTRNQSEARRVGMRRGYYHFAYPQSNTALSEANWFVSQVGTVQSGEILVLDYEQDLGNQVAWCKTFLDRVYTLTGVKPLIYLNLSTVNAYDWSSVKNDGYGLWVAYWDGSANPAVPSTQWGYNTIKQYSDSGSVGGISPVDLDVFNGDAWGLTYEMSGPGVCTMNANRIDIATRGAGNDIRVRTWNSGSGWTTPVSLGGTTYDQLAMCSRSNGSYEVFHRGIDNSLYVDSYLNGVWYGWQNLGGPITSGPAAVCRDSNHIDVYARGSNNQLVTKGWYNGTWYAWQNVAGPTGTLTSAPSAVSRDASHIDVYVRGSNNQLLTIGWLNGTWYGWQDLGGSLTSNPYACNRDANHIEVFARGAGNAIFVRSWYNGNWYAWENLGANATTAPAACCPNSSTIKMYHRGIDNNLYERTWSGSWGPYVAVGVY